MKVIPKEKKPKNKERKEATRFQTPKTRQSKQC
jgi:hypothetical protein